ncbi:MAG: MBL fold metallo-hydrolase [Thomasclavelia sp.]|jgi:L-ascorbate metabolism protein UlaG (beta-lactamase superfamily)|nr:MBL fold metallo-hydrolase [Thomasclavelia sp.]
MKIKYFGHSCFSINYNDYTIVLDPYANESVPGLKPLEVSANLVLCSHNHSDHSAKERVKIIKTSIKNPFKIEKISSFHDDKQGSLRGDNIIHLITTDNLRIAHLGDLGCDLNQSQIDNLRNLDVLMIPIGGHYTIDASKASEIIDILKPKTVIPMHYRTHTWGLHPISTLEPFIKIYPNTIISESNELSVPSDNKVIALTYR